MIKKAITSLAIKRQFFHMITHVLDSGNLSQEIFAVDTWRAVIYTFWDMVASTCLRSFRLYGDQALTIAEHASDIVAKRILRLLIHRLQIFLVKYEYL